ncbi:hypothetical protein [Intestinibacter bartlettii]|uniref:Lipoprotein n=1 Tax=Intestinibacter bartlettii TaxID=261299 RepID=A0ABS6E1P9_9FIRM|nr:hypothetical protein [Intestinibacter bartlettii]MBU5337381.1 hypothetical protein [Intestinibacter bartlettii]MDO5009753.1 hypothetical protein [Intestinibacter bartlettii]
MKKLLILSLIAFILVGCSNTDLSKSSQTTTTDNKSSNGELNIEDVEGYWECKSDEDGILLKLGWKNDIDLYYIDGSREKNSYSVTDSSIDSIGIEMKTDNGISNITIKSDDNGDTIALKRNEKTHYFIRIPKDKFYIKLDEEYGGK